MRIMEEKTETTIMGYLGFRIQGLGLGFKIQVWVQGLRLRA